MSFSPVPNLATSLTGPLLQIESRFLDRQEAIERWFRDQWRQSRAPFYGSVDLRNAGFKLAPVDTNLFPAGFNNLDRSLLPLGAQAVQSAVEHICPMANGILIVIESHTRNPYYFENLAALQRIVRTAGFACELGTLREITATETRRTDSGIDLQIHPIERAGNRLLTDDFDPCLVLLNNDLSDTVPESLLGLEQPVVPDPRLGWQSRRKSVHFGLYQSVCEEFSDLIDIDPWLLTPYFRNCGKIDFQQREGEDCLVKNVDRLLTDIQAKYQAYDIDREPFVFIKSDSGTYGMGIMTARSVDEVRDLNRKQRKKMAAAKGSQKVTQVLVQEGVYTFETYGDERSTAEPVVYMIDHSVVGGFYRLHSARDDTENLNAPGMTFEPLAFADCCMMPDEAMDPDASVNRFYAYGVVARLALLAAAREAAGLTSEPVRGTAA